ncbi:MAG: hypothetical protein BGO88_03050 [Flavobacterium sp. 38-13]|uniref:hypothetical protein n=1 Tax=Flavobacterium sp. 38-13 TaxID=1896168 RepID=UPI00095CD7EE|nr:hypothetical protein [Flavobacterium sp. 38-13]OJX54867.1 MAG: hypothetical protein BGO88_03050 [Flavobacterium sp. 38-13]
MPLFISTINITRTKGTPSLAEIIMKKIIYGFILLFSISAFSQDYKFGFSSRYPITYDSKGDYIRGAEEKVEGSFFFVLTSVDFELKGDVYKKLTASGTSFDDRHPDLYEMVTITSIQTPERQVRNQALSVS